MGMTALEPGSNWNTMPSHTHERRMEIYTYFEVPEGQAVFHMCGELLRPATLSCITMTLSSAPPGASTAA